jgi:hypothetical protein
MKKCGTFSVVPSIINDIVKTLLFHQFEVFLKEFESVKKIDILLFVLWSIALYSFIILGLIQ